MVRIGEKHPPAVLARSSHPLVEIQEIVQEVAQIQSASKDAPVEGLIVACKDAKERSCLETLRTSLVGAVPLIVVENNASGMPPPPFREDSSPRLALYNGLRDRGSLADFLQSCEDTNCTPALAFPAKPMEDEIVRLLGQSSTPPIITLLPTKGINSVAGYRTLAAILDERELNLPIWIRNQDPGRLFPDDESFSGRLLDSSILSGALLCDGTGDLISVENAGDLDRNRGLSYNILQGARARISKRNSWPVRVAEEPV